jgi:acetyl esterase/lipase
MILLLFSMLIFPPVPMEDSIVKIWPEGKMPGLGAKDPESIVPAKNDSFQRITNVSTPTLTLFKVKRDTPTPAVIISPGGGYNYTVVDKEGSEIADWLNTQGITAMVLKYRTPKNRDGALQDLQRAIRIVRSNAKAWSIDPDKIGTMGFSAGGHLTAKAMTHFDTPSYTAIDAIDTVSAKPDFCVLVYPAYLEDKTGPGSPEFNLKAKLPPLLIIHNDDDKTLVAGTKLFHKALDDAKITHQFQCYTTGGHGYGLHCTGEAKAWPEATLKWLKANGIR